MCVATIFIRTFEVKLLAKNSNTGERDPDTNIQTEAIGMQSLLRYVIVTGHLPTYTV